MHTHTHTYIRTHTHTHTLTHTPTNPHTREPDPYQCVFVLRECERKKNTGKKDTRATTIAAGERSVSHCGLCMKTFYRNAESSRKRRLEVLSSNWISLSPSSCIVNTLARTSCVYPLAFRKLESSSTALPLDPCSTLAVMFRAFSGSHFSLAPAQNNGKQELNG